VYLWDKVVEWAKILIAVFLLLCVVSGYGMLYPTFFGPLGLTYRTFAYIHTHPLVRYLVTVLAALHGYGGVVVLSSRYLRKYGVLRIVVEVLALLVAVAVIAMSTAIELALLLRW